MVLPRGGFQNHYESCFATSFRRATRSGLNSSLVSARVDTRYDNQRGFGIHLIKDAQPLHLLRLALIVLGGAEVVTNS